MTCDVFLSRLAQVAAKAQTTNGTAIALSASDVTERTGDESFSFDQETFESEVFGADLSMDPDFIGNVAGEVSFFTYLKGSGTAATAPGFGNYLEQSGQWKEAAGGGGIVYTPESSDTGYPATVGIYRKQAVGSGGRGYIIKGARLSNVSMTFRPGEPGRIEVTYRGAYSAHSDTFLTTTNYGDATQPPVLKQADITLGTWTPLVKEITISIDYGLGQVDDPGNDAETSGICAFQQTSRSVTGTIQFLAIPQSQENYLDDLLAGGTRAFNLKLGTVSGNMVDIDMPALQYLTNSETNLEDLLADGLDFRAARGPAGDDEISITTT